MQQENCIFCKIGSGEIPSVTLYENTDFRIIFDIAPASKGHVLIIPKKHFQDLFDLDTETAGKLFALATSIAKAMKKELGFDGMNVLQNNGEAAGQTVMHFHLHLIPRYTGDTLKFGWSPGTADNAELKTMADAIRRYIS